MWKRIETESERKREKYVKWGKKPAESTHACTLRYFLCSEWYWVHTHAYTHRTSTSTMYTHYCMYTRTHSVIFTVYISNIIAIANRVVVTVIECCYRSSCKVNKKNCHLIQASTNTYGRQSSLLWSIQNLFYSWVFWEI